VGAKREPNGLLAAVMHEAGISNKGLAAVFVPRPRRLAMPFRQTMCRSAGGLTESVHMTTRPAVSPLL